jgi:hypothetical protein
VSLIPEVPKALYHYTCLDHGHPGIYGSGLIKPGNDTLVWLTDLDLPMRDAVGLTRVSTGCDRGAARYRVETAGLPIVPWLEFRKGVPWHLIEFLESFPGVMPRHWFVSARPTPATYDPQSPDLPTTEGEQL